MAAAKKKAPAKAPKKSPGLNVVSARPRTDPGKQDPRALGTKTRVGGHVFGTFSD